MDLSVENFNVRLRTIKIRELVIGIIVCMILTGLIGLIFPPVIENDDLLILVLLTIMIILFAILFFNTTGLSEDIRNVFKPKTRKEIIYVVVINILFVLLIAYLLSSLDYILQITDPTWISSVDIDTVEVDSTYILYDAVTSIIYAPIIEEIIFRGILFNRLKIRTGILAAMIISSFIFAIGHEFGGIISAFLFGICMCMIYLKTDNIIITISAHMLNNIIATALNFTAIDMFFIQFPYLIPALLICIIATVFLIKYILDEYKKIKKQYS